MVQQLFGEVERLKAEVARLRGKLDSIAVGNQVILNPNVGNNPVPPAAPGASIFGTAGSQWGRRDAGNEGDVYQMQSGFPIWDIAPAPVNNPASMPHTSGQYYGAPSVQFTPTTASYIANFIRAVPFYVPISGTYDRATLEVQAAAAGNNRIGIWGPIPATGAISSLPLLLDTGSINTGTTGVKTATISLTLPQGWYVIGQVSDSTNTLRAYPAGALVTEIGDPVPFGSSRTRNYWFASFTYGALPNPITTLAPAGDADLMPMVQLRRQ